MTHDPFCPVSTTRITDCPLCALLKAARDAERDVYQRSWKVNLPLIERRNYIQGWTDAINGRRLGP